jgi:nucleoside-diphosphate-sugar epimerase
MISSPVRTARSASSSWERGDNTKAKFLLGWRPSYDLERLVEAAFEYERGPDDPRVIYDPG